MLSLFTSMRARVRCPDTMFRSVAERCDSAVVRTVVCPDEAKRRFMRRSSLRLENARFHGQAPFAGHQAKIALLVSSVPPDQVRGRLLSLRHGSGRGARAVDEICLETLLAALPLAKAKLMAA